MVQEPDLSRQGPEEIREKIEATRSDLTVKLEALEHRVRETVADAKGAVTDTVETVKQTVDSTVCAVKESVHDAVDSVKDSLDLSRQVDRHPWAMLAGSIAAGFVTGRLLDRPTTGYVTVNPAGPYPTQNGNGRLGDSTGLGGGTARRSEARTGLLSELGDRFGPEIGQLKGLAIGALMSLAREFVKDAVAPALAPDLERVIDDVTSKLGGKPLHGEIWPHGERFRGP